jgi:hypothetical protein
VINSILAAVFVSLLTARLFTISLLLSVLIGAVVFAASEWLHFRYQSRAFVAVDRTLKVHFPSEKKNDR